MLNAFIFTFSGQKFNSLSYENARIKQKKEWLEEQWKNIERNETERKQKIKS